MDYYEKKNKDEEGSVCCLCCLLLPILILILMLDYYPFTQIELKEGLCKNSKSVYLLNSNFGALYVYETDIYNKENVFIDKSFGCIGTDIASYRTTVGEYGFNNIYPYDSITGYLPVWLCSYSSYYSNLWRLITPSIGALTYEEIDLLLWNNTEIKNCKYGKLDVFKNYNKKKIANVENNKYMVTMDVMDDNYHQIKNTMHYIMLLSAIVFCGVCFVLSLLNACSKISDELEIQNNNIEIINI